MWKVIASSRYCYVTGTQWGKANSGRKCCLEKGDTDVADNQYVPVIVSYLLIVCAIRLGEKTLPSEDYTVSSFLNWDCPQQQIFLVPSSSNMLVEDKFRDIQEAIQKAKNEFGGRVIPPPNMIDFLKGTNFIIFRPRQFSAPGIQLSRHPTLS